MPRYYATRTAGPVTDADRYFVIDSAGPRRDIRRRVVHVSGTYADARLHAAAWNVAADLTLPAIRRAVQP